MPEPTSAYTERLTTFQQWVAQQGLDWFWVPSSDVHLNEYLPPVWKRRDWLCGFTGSAGDLLVSSETAWLFVDSRYHEQADTEVPLEHVQVSKLGQDGAKTLTEFLEAQLSESPTKTDMPLRLGVDAQTLSAQTVEQLRKRAAKTQRPLEIIPITPNPVDTLQQAETPTFSNPVIALPHAWTGQTIAEKLVALRQTMAKAGVQLWPVSRLDEVAWLFNLRGSDIPYNPVFMAFALVTPDKAFLCMDTSRLTEEAHKALSQAQVQPVPYEAFWSLLETLGRDQRVGWCASSHSNAVATLLTHLPGTALHPMANPIQKAKALKNLQELEQMRQANAKASRAIIRVLAWLDDRASQAIPTTEADIARQVEAFYADEDGFHGLSFNTIAGVGANSSIVHYGTPSPSQVAQPNDWVLLDSGAHFGGGTTDATRTTVFGHQPSAQQRHVYTTVLKGHIAAACARFPKGTTGQPLDALCRGPLWQAGMDYGHGTGHGVGAFLNVHEGPVGLHRRAETLLEPGHVVSIEPGYYQPGWGGIRLENLVQVTAAEDNDTDWVAAAGSPMQSWYAFAPLTLVPFEARLMDAARLTDLEKRWLRDYYQTIARQVLPLLATGQDQRAATWLRQQLQWTEKTTLSATCVAT